MNYKILSDEMLKKQCEFCKKECERLQIKTNCICCKHYVDLTIDEHVNNID